MEYLIDIYTWLMSLDGVVAKLVGSFAALVGVVVATVLIIVLVGLLFFKLISFFTSFVGIALIAIFIFVWITVNKDDVELGTEPRFTESCGRQADCLFLLWEIERLQKEGHKRQGDKP